MPQLQLVMHLLSPYLKQEIYRRWRIYDDLLNKEKKAVNINYREKAPNQSSKNMFLDKNGEINNESVDTSHLSSGVPGTVYGLNFAQKKIWQVIS